jgi:hypothetical protein
LKKHFILIFESVVQVFLSFEQNVENVKGFYNQLFSQVQSITSASGISNVTVTKGALYVCQVALQSIRSISILKSMFEGVAKTLCKLVDDHIAALGGYLMQIGQMMSQQAQLTIEVPAVAATLQSLEVIQEWLNIHNNIMERWESRNNFGYAHLSESASYAQSLAKILSIMVPGAVVS